MLNIIANLDNRKRMEFFVDHCELRTPEEVARLFEEYTILIWTYLLAGKIYDFYPDDIVMHHANGVAVQGIENVFSGTLGAFTSIPGDNQTVFIDIFAEGDPENGYSFIQATTGYRPGLHDGAPYEIPEGRVCPEHVRGKIGLCECKVRKVDGRWMIVEEWLVRAHGGFAKE